MHVGCRLKCAMLICLNLSGSCSMLACHLATKRKSGF